LQLHLPFLQTPPADPRIDFVRVGRARRYILRVRPDGSLRITVPRGGSRAEAMRFLERHLHWVLQERLRLAAQHAPVEWHEGGEILLDGVRVRLTRDGRAIRAGDRLLAVAPDAGDWRPAVEAGLRDLARELLPPRLHELAALHGLCVARVTIRSQRSRWGSCSRSGNIALNFRLVQMPPAVRDYVLIHELMHLKQQNHGPRFWRLVMAACPAYRAAEDWLRAQGRALF
jgi:predicted metal-dependent hydrolase